MKIFVLSLTNCKDRKERIITRLKYHNLLEETTFVEAVSPNSQELKDFEKDNTIPRISNRLEHCCFLSHIKGLRAFVESGKEKGMIFEDDAMPHNNFSKLLKEILEVWDKLPYVIINDTAGKVNLILTSPYVNSWDNVRLLNNNPQICSMTSRIFGTVSYIITREWAQECLSRFDKPLKDLPDERITSEVVPILARGAFCIPPLVIEESIYSIVQSKDQLNNHRKYFSNFGIENYLAAEEEDVRKKWKGYT